jgi:hypothetical protein
MAIRIENTQARWSHKEWCERLRALLSLWRAALSAVLGAGFIAQAGGCTRPFFRNHADEEVSEVLAQKDKYADWKIDNWHVYPDPRARFGDPSDPDHPPKPPDDPAAYDLSPNPQKPGKAGVARVEGTGYLELIAQWDKENRERIAREEAEEKKKTAEPLPLKDENGQEAQAGHDGQADPKAVSKKAPPSGQFAAYVKATTGPASDESMKKTPPAQRDAIAEAKERSLLDITGRPTYLLTLDQAAELATFNSREYQDHRESLYLAALPVTRERFSFMAQFFAAQEAAREYSGSKAPGGKTNNWSLNSGTGSSKFLPTGALLLLNFSNQTVFDFLNPKKTLSTSTLNFNAIQPLLRGGGEAVALESLTEAERNLLYQIRSFARFRKELYVEIASANGGSINGGAFQPTGVLSSGGGGSLGLGALGLTPGEFARVSTTLTGPLVPPGTPGALALSPALTPAPSGYLNTMLQKIQVYIAQEDIDVLSGILLRFRGLLDGDLVGPLQVQSVEQQLLTGRATLLLNQTQYLQSLDSFKIEIGVPMKLSIEMDDSVLRPLMNQFRRSRAILENEQAAVAEASTFIALEKAPMLRAELLRLFQKSTLVKGTPFADRIRDRWSGWEKLSTKDLNARLEDLRKEAQKLLDLQAELQKKEQVLSPADAARLKEVNAQRDLGDFERALRQYEADYVDMGKPKKPADAAGERKRLTQFQNVVYSWQKVLVEARDDQWDVVRASWPELPRCCVDGVDLIHEDLSRAQAVGAQHALENRLDLMNTRAQVVDAWRQIAVFANSLLGTFNVQYQMNASSPVGVPQPLNIGGSRTSHDLILDTQLPLTRIQERNNYRASLIAYQRQRRTLQEAEDLAVQVVDNELFLLRQFADQYKLQQRQLELAYLTIDNAMESLQAPTPPPALPGQTRAAQDGPAGLTQQLLSAQRSLPTAQNGLLTIWINYLNARLQLYRDLELMPLDARGVWIDEIRDCDCGLNAEKASGPALPPAGDEQLLPQPQKVPPAHSEPTEKVNGPWSGRRAPRISPSSREGAPDKE